jgi:hypothetical protein
MIPQQPNRKKLLDYIEKVDRSLIKKIRADRNYKMPPNYVDWKTITALTSVCLQGCDPTLPHKDISAFIHSYRYSLWFAKDAPIYCLSEAMLEAFDRTDTLHKPGILSGWLPSLPTFMLALPKGIIYSPDGGEIDYLVVSCASELYPEWETAKWKEFKLCKLYEQQHPLYFQIVATDSLDTVWTSGTAVAGSDLIYDENSSIGSSQITQADRQFIASLRNLVINVFLALENSSEFISKVSPKEAKKKFAFGIDRPHSTDRYPRWLGRNYQSKSANSAPNSEGTHASPRAHWRRGHWRTLQPGENKRWRDTRKIWIEPTWIN